MQPLDELRRDLLTLVGYLNAVSAATQAGDLDALHVAVDEARAALFKIYGASPRLDAVLSRLVSVLQIEHAI